MKKLNFINVSKELSRDEMKSIMAGSCSDGSRPPCDGTGGGGGGETCKQFHDETGCYPTFNTPSDCVGKDGRTYSYASSSGSCS